MSYDQEKVQVNVEVKVDYTEKSDRGNQDTGWQKSLEADQSGDQSSGDGNVKYWRRNRFAVDTRYPRSIEGILRIASIPFAVVLFILVVVAGGPYGGWHGFLCVCWVIYVVIVFVVEMFIPEFYVHRLIDAVIAIIYAVLFAIATLVSIILAAIVMSSATKGVLGAAVIFAAVCCALAATSGGFALYTWRTHEEGRKGSQPIIMI